MTKPGKPTSQLAKEWLERRKGPISFGGRPWMKAMLEDKPVILNAIVGTKLGVPNANNDVYSADKIEIDEVQLLNLEKKR